MGDTAGHKPCNNPGNGKAKCSRTISASELDKENTKLRQENAELKKKGCILEKTISDLKTKIESIENEKLSLITAIKLVQDDNNSTSLNNRHSTYSTWQVPKSNVRSRSRTRRETFDGRRNKTFASTEINNQMQKTATSNQ